MTNTHYLKKSQWLEATQVYFPDGRLITNKIDTTEHVVSSEGFLVAAWFSTGYGRVWKAFSKRMLPSLVA